MGRDIIVTIIVIWIINKLYSSFKNNKSYIFQKNEHYHQYENNQDKLNIKKNKSTKSSIKDEGEYVDYEEIK